MHQGVVLIMAHIIYVSIKKNLYIQQSVSQTVGHRTAGVVDKLEEMLCMCSNPLTALQTLSQLLLLHFPKELQRDLQK